MGRKTGVSTLPKRFLTMTEVCHVYSTTPDFLETVSVAELPRNRRGYRTLLFDVIDLEAFFAKFRVAGDEAASRRRELPAALPVAVTVPRSTEAA